MIIITCSRQYWVIEFDDGIQIVPISWLLENNTKCYYPNDLGNGPNVHKKYDMMVKNLEQPKNNWEIYDIKHIWGSDGMYVICIVAKIFIYC